MNSTWKGELHMNKMLDNFTYYATEANFLSGGNSTWEISNSLYDQNFNTGKVKLTLLSIPALKENELCVYLPIQIWNQFLAVSNSK